jgi:queuine/archaeosine tRNA-ribosyltransferase
MALGSDIVMAFDECTRIPPPVIMPNNPRKGLRVG